MTTIAEDAFTGPNGTNLVDHAPDVGLGTWTYDGAATVLTIQGNAVSASEISVDRFARGSDVVADDLFEVKEKLAVDSFATGPKGALWCLGAGTVGEGVALEVHRASASTINIVFQRRDATGAIVQTETVLAGFSYAGGASSGAIWIGLIVDGLEVTPFREEADETGRVTFTAIAIPDLRDGNHRFAGIMARRGSFNRVIKPDHLRVLSINQPPTAPTITAPADGAVQGLSTPLTVAWDAATDPESDPLQYEGDYSDNGGMNWIPLFALQGALTFAWNLTALAPGAEYQVRVRAHDGELFGPYDTTANFSIYREWASETPGVGSWASETPGVGSWASDGGAPGTTWVQD